MLRAIWSAFAHGRLRDTTLNVELFRRLVNGAGAIHVAFGLPPPSLADRWTFYPASFELTDSDPDMYGAPVHIRFTHLQHVAHDMDDAIKILTHTEGKATFEGKQHADYKGPCLWWSAPVPPPGNTSCPSLNRGDSRHGSVRFSFPVREVLSLHSKQYQLGTRHYNQEWAHTILLSSNEVHGLGAVLPRVDLADSALTQWPVGADATEATWKCYRHASDDWDHLEFACEIPQGKTLSFDPKKNQVKIDFVAHDKYCVKHLSSVNHSRKQPTALACRRVSSRAAALQFRDACNAADPNLLSKQNDSGFFSEDVWRQIRGKLPLRKPKFTNEAEAEHNKSSTQKTRAKKQTEAASASPDSAPESEKEHKKSHFIQSILFKMKQLFVLYHTMAMGQAELTESLELKEKPKKKKKTQAGAAAFGSGPESASDSDKDTHSDDSGQPGMRSDSGEARAAASAAASTEKLEPIKKKKPSRRLRTPSIDQKQASEGTFY